MDSELKDPSVHEINRKPVQPMINKYNVGELNLVERPVSAAKSGFGSALPRHPDNHNQRYFETENRAFYGTPSTTLHKRPVTAVDRQAGVNARSFDQQGTKIISNLVGEIYSKNYDP
jgi:hypothetical protein